MDDTTGDRHLRVQQRSQIERRSMPHASALVKGRFVRVLWMLAGCLFTVACAERNPPCVSAAACGEGMECLANRCVPRGAEPVPQATVRYVLEPTSQVMVAEDSPAAIAPTSLLLGNAVHGDVTLLLEFAWPELEAAVGAGFLVFEPLVGAPATRRDVDVRVYSVLESWRPERVSVVTVPELGLPSARGLARSAPPMALRIDVTELVRSHYKEPWAYHGIAVTASAGAGHGVSYRLSNGPSPRLELYAQNTPGQAPPKP